MADQNREPGPRPGLPLPYIAILAGFVAAVCPILALELAAAASGWIDPLGLGPGASAWASSLRSPLFFLAPASACAALVMLFIALPMHAVIVLTGFVNRWTYAAGMLLIIGSAYLLLFSGYIDPVEALRHPVGTGFFLVPIAAIPSGMFFHALLKLPVAPLGRRDALIVATWCGAWMMMLVTFGLTRRFAPDPLHTRDEIVRLASAYGTGAFMLFGVLAGLGRLRSLRLGSFIAAASWLIPLGFLVVYRATPLGPEKIRFTIAGQEFVLDWHLDPRGESSGLSFDAAKRGPYEIAGRRQLNRRIYISATGEALSPLLSSPTGAGSETGRQRSQTGLTCEQQGTGRMACAALNDMGQTTTLLECRPGYCFHRFDHDGLRYGLHIDREDLSDWIEIQKRAVQLLADVNQASSPEGAAR